MQLKLKIFSLLTAVLTSLSSGVAHAHHPNDFKTPDSLIDGLLSGVGHPVIGLDHLVFVIAIGLIGYLMKQRIKVASVFIGGTLFGTLIHLAQLTIPFAEVLVAISVVLVGVSLFYKLEKLPSIIWCSGLVLAGTLHGYVYGEAIVGAEVTPLAAYLIGFMSIQLFIALIAAFFCQWGDSSRAFAAANLARFYGGIAVCSGTFFLVS